MRSLRFMLRFVGVVQLFFGVLFTFAPATASVAFACIRARLAG